jgi:hypothetical protein
MCVVGSDIHNLVAYRSQQTGVRLVWSRYVR